MSNDNDFTPFSRIYADSKPSKIWDIPENYNFANSSPSCVLAHGQQDSFKLAFSAIKCFWTHSNTHLPYVRLLLPSVTIGGM